MTDLAQLELDLINAIGDARTAAAVEELRVAALGKSGSISGLLKGMGALSPDERREQGPVINGLRDRVSAALAARKAALEGAELDARLKAEHIDLTLPSRPRRAGSVHPTMQVMDEMIAVFADMGFAVAEGPDIEDDFHNFTALNFPPKHPAREMHDTFFLRPDPETGERKVLRTHTSPVQVRTMMTQTPPIRILSRSKMSPLRMSSIAVSGGISRTWCVMSSAKRSSWKKSSYAFSSPGRLPLPRWRSLRTRRTSFTRLDAQKMRSPSIARVADDRRDRCDHRERRERRAW